MLFRSTEASNMSVVVDYITLKISSGKNVHCNIYNISISRGARISTHPSFHFITILCLNGSLHGETVLQIDGEYVVYDVRLLTIEEPFLVLFRTNSRKTLYRTIQHILHQSKEPCKEPFKRAHSSIQNSWYYIEPFLSLESPIFFKSVGT